jgi:hypothetical protein
MSYGTYGSIYINIGIYKNKNDKTNHLNYKLIFLFIIYDFLDFVQFFFHLHVAAIGILFTTRTLL